MQRRKYRKLGNLFSMPYVKNTKKLIPFLHRVTSLQSTVANYNPFDFYWKWSEINRKRFIGIERVYECQDSQFWRAIIRKEEEIFVGLQALHRDASLSSDIVYGGSNMCVSSFSRNVYD